MTFGSLFSGCGGADLGFEQAGLTCAWQCEIDRQARSVLKRHWPGVPVFEDVCEVGVKNLEPVDVVLGGFPCQDLSVAGRGAGLSGERSGLFFELHRVLAELRPQWVVIENVPGLLSNRGGRDFAIALRRVAELGYRICGRVLDSQYHNLAQRRERVFLVGHLGDGRAAEVLFDPESLSWDSAPRREAGVPHADGTQVGIDFRWCPSVAKALTADCERLDFESETFLVDHHGVRRLTPRECERLQGFPDDFTRYGHDGKELKDGPRYRMIGNAVSTPVAKRLGERLIAANQRACVERQYAV